MNKILPIILVVVLSGCSGNIKTPLENCADSIIWEKIEVKTEWSSIQEQQYVLEDTITKYSFSTQRIKENCAYLKEIASQACVDRLAGLVPDFSIDPSTIRDWDNSSILPIKECSKKFIDTWTGFASPIMEFCIVGHPYETITLTELKKLPAIIGFSRTTIRTNSDKKELNDIVAEKLKAFEDRPVKSKLDAPFYRVAMEYCSIKKNKNPDIFESEYK